MALTRTDRGGGITTGDSQATSAFTPAADSLLVAICGGDEEDTSPVATSVSGGGLTWTLRASATYTDSNSTWTSKIYIYTAQVGSSPSSMTVTASNADTMDGTWLHVVEYSGHNAASPVGAVITGQRRDVTGAWTVTLPTAPASDSEVIAGGNIDNYDTTNNWTTGTGWTQLYKASVSETYAHAQVRGGSTSTSVTWNLADTDTGDFYGMGVVAAIEIKAASGGTPVDITPPATDTTVAPATPVVASGASVAAPAVDTAMTALAPTIETFINVFVPATDTAIAAFAPAIYAGVNLSVPSADTVVTALVPAIEHGTIINIPSVDTVMTVVAPVIGSGVNIAVPVTDTGVAAFTPTILTGVNVAVPSINTDMATFAPGIEASGLTIPTADFVMAAFAPSVIGGVNLDIPLFGYEMLAAIPTVFADPAGLWHNVTPNSGGWSEEESITGIWTPITPISGGWAS